MSFDTLIKNGTVIDPVRGPLDVSIGIKDGKIAALLDPGLAPAADEQIDAKGLVVMPGAIDPHMHIGFVGMPLDDVETETRSGAIGGVTSILTYVLNAGDYSGLFAEFMDHIDRQAYVDMGIHFGIFSSEQVAALPAYIDEYGVSSFKFFMSYKGDEGTKRGVGETDDGLLYELMEAAAALPGTVVNVHAENIEIIWREERKVREAGLEGAHAHNASRPGISEATAMATAGYLGRATGAQVYFVHTSSKEGVEVVTGLRRRGRPRLAGLRRDDSAQPLADRGLAVRAALQGQPAGANPGRHRRRSGTPSSEASSTRSAPTMRPAPAPTSRATSGLPAPRSPASGRCSPCCLPTATTAAGSRCSGSRRSRPTTPLGSSTCPRRAGSRSAPTPTSRSSTLTPSASSTRASSAPAPTSRRGRTSA